MEQVKIQVLGADGKYRGGLFKDGPWHEHRWTGEPKPNLQESMVCTGGDLNSGEWFLIQYVLPRQIVGDAAADSLFDEASSCCRRTAVQALLWFAKQAFGPPPALVERVRSFATAWSEFCLSESARNLLQNVIARGFVDDDDDLLTGFQGEQLELLRRLELVHVASGTKESYFADAVLKDMGVLDYVAWMSDHLTAVSGVVGQRLAKSAIASNGSAGSPVSDTVVVVGTLIAQAIELACFAGRWSDDWRCVSGRPRMEIEAISRLRDSSVDSGLAMQDAAAALIASEQAVIDAKNKWEQAELTAQTIQDEGRDGCAELLQQHRHGYQARCEERDHARRSAELAAEAAPATAAKLRANALDSVDDGRRESLGHKAGPAWIAVPLAAKVLSPLAQRRIAAAENEMAAEWLQVHGCELRQSINDFLAMLSPYRVALANIAPEGGRSLGRWLGTCWSEALVKMLRALLVAAEQRNVDVLQEVITELRRERLMIDLQIELVKASASAQQIEGAQGEGELGGWNKMTIDQIVQLWRKAASDALGFIEREWVSAGSFGPPIPADIADLNHRWRTRVSAKHGAVRVLAGTTADLRDLGLIDGGLAEQLLDVLKGMRMPGPDSLAVAIEAVRAQIEQPLPDAATSVQIGPCSRPSAPAPVREPASEPEHPLPIPTPEPRLVDQLASDQTGSKPPDTAPPPAPTLFAQFYSASSGVWQLGYGSTIKPVRSSRGMKYVHALLSAPGKEVHVWVLEHGVEPPPETPAYLTDEATIESVRTAVESKKRELDETTDLNRREELEDEINKARSYLTASLSTRNGMKALRRERSECEKLREAVGKAIRNALEAIKQEIPDLYDHLARWIRNPTGMTPRYACPEGGRPQWVLQPPGVARES